jgi:hypothetical protein
VPKDLYEHMKRKEVIYLKKEIGRRAPDPKTTTNRR